MGSCIAAIFKGEGGRRGRYAPLRTSSTARYGTNSRNQSYLGPGYSGSSHETEKNKSANGLNWLAGGGGNTRKPVGSSTAASSRGGALTCPSCGFTTSYKREMHHHIAAQHGGKVKRPHAPRQDFDSKDEEVGGTAGERARAIKWSDLHKSEKELAEEHFAREHPEHARQSRPDTGKTNKTSRLKAASQRASSLVRSARSTLSSNFVTRGTRGTSSTTFAKSKAKKKKKKRKERK